MESDWLSLLGLLKKQKDVETLDKLFRVFFTADEIEMASSRFRLIGMLLEGTFSQRDIAQRLSVSLATVSRGSNLLKTVDDDIKKKISLFYRKFGGS